MPGSSARLVVLLVGLCALVIGAHLPLLTDMGFGKDKVRGGLVKMKLALARGAAHPAVFLGGGSNMLAGLRAATVSDILHQPVYNLGLPNELGDYRSAIAFLEQAAQPGDTLVYASRGFHVEAPFRRDNSASTHTEPTFSQIKRFEFELPEQSVLRMLRPEVGANLWEEAEYLNRLGDFPMCLYPEKRLRPQGFLGINAGREGFLDELAQFSQRMKARGVRVFFMAPELLVNSEDLSNWSNLYQNTRSQLEKSGAQWINFVENEVFITDPREFCDSPFHPNEQRAIMYSQKLAQQLVVRN